MSGVRNWIWTKGEIGMATGMADIPHDKQWVGAPEKKLTGAFVGVGLVAMLLGFLLGPPQALNYAGIDIYDYLPLSSYYQGLTLHGVLMALVFTSFFIGGLLLYLPAREMNLKPHMGLGWIAFWMMTIGTVMAGIAMITDTSTVLYTLYPPMEGHWSFYLGLALVVVATLIIAAMVLMMWRTWKGLNPGRPTPIVTYMSVITWLMWAIASVGLAVGVVGLLLPWSLGWMDGVDPALFRTLFWYTGHPIVYFWLLPAYVVWYAVVPAQAGGKLVSDPMARLVFLLFLLFSIPTGFHHQYADPGIPDMWKLVHNVTTMFVAIPSLITAFTVAASLENAGRARGGSGWFGWIGVLPWKNPGFTAAVLAMVTFIFGGAGGIILASFNLNLMVHNTAFIPGHFHITVGTAVTMTFMGAAFWLLPQLTDKPLRSVKSALVSVWLWFIGMMIFALGMHWQGILGVPRRAHISDMQPELFETYAHALFPGYLTGIGGMLLLISGLLFFWSLARTLMGPRDPENVEPLRFADTVSGPYDASGQPKRTVQIMDRLGWWLLLAVLLIVVAYAPTIMDKVLGWQAVPGFQLW